MIAVRNYLVMYKKKKTTDKAAPAPAAAAKPSVTSTGDSKMSTKSAPAAAKPSVTSTGDSKMSTKSAPSKSTATAAGGAGQGLQVQTKAPAAAATSTKTDASPKLADKAARMAKGAKGFFKRMPTVVGLRAPAAEATRLQEDMERKQNWKRWGPYLSERQWATVREDYSPDGSW